MYSMVTIIHNLLYIYYNIHYKSKARIHYVLSPNKLIISPPISGSGLKGYKLEGKIKKNKKYLLINIRIWVN